MTALLWGSRNQLEEVLHAQLYLTRAAQDRVEDPPERGIRAHGRGGWNPEAGSIEHVGRVDADLQSLPPHDARPLRDRNVQVREHRAAEKIPADVAEPTGIRIRELRSLFGVQVPHYAAFVVHDPFAPRTSPAVGRRL